MPMDHSPRSKNTVSSGPCKTTLPSNIPGPASVFFAIRVERRAGSTRFMIGAFVFRTSPGKYIRVAGRFRSPRMNTEINRCGACSWLSGPGTVPGLIVVKQTDPCWLGGIRPYHWSPCSKGCPVSLPGVHIFLHRAIPVRSRTTVRLPPRACTESAPKAAWESVCSKTHTGVEMVGLRSRVGCTVAGKGLHDASPLGPTECKQAGSTCQAASLLSTPQRLLSGALLHLLGAFGQRSSAKSWSE